MYSNLVKYVPNRKPPMGAVLNPYLPINRGIAGDWPGWEGAGDTVEDLSGNNWTGTFGGDPLWVPGKFGHALDFDGAGDYVDIGLNSYADDIYSGNNTISIWVATTSSSIMSLIGTVNDGSSYLFFIWINANDAAAASPGDIFIGLRGSNSAELLYGGTTGNANPSLYDGNLHHIVVQTNGTTVHKLFIDGVAQIVSYSTNNLSSSTSSFQYPFWFGCYNNRNSVGNALTGQIDEVKLYNRALSASEIASLYREPFCGFRWPNIIELASYIEAVGENVMAAHYYRRLLQGAA